MLMLSIACGFSGAAWAEAPFAFERAPGQLPKDVVPLAYRIDIKTDLDALQLAGAEAVDADWRRETDSVTLNQAGLTLSRATLEDGSPATITQDETLQTATLRFAHPVSLGHHTLSITYSGPIPATPNGIYYDDYKTDAGAKRRMVVTQFEVADARRMFPGWDEPAFKASFQLSVTLPEKLQAVSNMPIASTTPAGPGLKHVVFAPSPRMSTYLLALVAGDIGALFGRADGTDIGLWAPAGTQLLGEYGLQAATRILPFYNSYFGVAYPLPKLDLIAIPGNFEAGAMENWGAITFIDNALLFDPAASSPRTKETVFIDVAHEMAHQWSGDLVTMGWWDNIWLNEGFATWMEIKAADHFNPDWEVWPRQHDAREDAMAQDAQPTTHAIQQVIHDVSEANTAFDKISYQKGEQVIRMVEDWIGPDVFRDGMRAYMAAHAYGNATSADLWAALGTAAHRDVSAVAATFTEQPGVPLVRVTRACRDGRAAITLSQDRFTIHDPHPKAQSWRIPVTFAPPGGTLTHLVLEAAPQTLAGGACDAAVKINAGEAGYYRTLYDPASLAALKTAFASLTPVDRANLLGDQFALFRAGRATLADYLDLLPAMAKERDVAVWEDTLSHLLRLDTLANGTPAQAPFRAFARALIAPEFAALGWTPRAGERFLDSLLRPELIAALGQFDDQAVVSEGRRRFAAFAKDPASLNPSLRDPVLEIVGRSADRATWETLRAMGEAATGTEDKLRFFTAMARARDPALIAANAGFASSGALPNGRIVRFLGGLSANAADQNLAWKEILANKDAIMARLAPWSRPAMLPTAASGTSNPAIAASLLAQPESQASIGGRVEAGRAADAIATTHDLKERAVPALAAWLSTHGS